MPPEPERCFVDSGDHARSCRTLSPLAYAAPPRITSSSCNMRSPPHANAATLLAHSFVRCEPAWICALALPGGNPTNQTHEPPIGMSCAARRGGATKGVNNILLGSTGTNSWIAKSTCSDERHDNLHAETSWRPTFAQVLRKHLPAAVAKDSSLLSSYNTTRNKTSF